MTLRSHRRNLVVWNQSVASAGRFGAPRPTRTRRIRRRFRAVALLTVVGLMRVVSPAPDRRQGSKLERELAGYSTPAERADLEAILARYPDDVTRELRDILASQAMTAYDDRFPAIGRY